MFLLLMLFNYLLHFNVLKYYEVKFACLNHQVISKISEIVICDIYSISTIIFFFSYNRFYLIL